MTRHGDFDFIVAGGARVGLGHVVRSARLAREAERRGFRVRAFLDGDAAARDVWRRSSGFDPRPAAGDDEAFAPVVALDLPGDKSAWLATLSRRASRALLIDDERDYAVRSPRPAAPPGWRLLPGLHHRPAPPNATDALGNAVLSGPRFALLDAAHRRRMPLPVEARTRVLVSLGGADPHRAGPRIARRVQLALATDARTAGLTGLDVVLGAAFEDPGGRDAARLREAGCTVHRALEAEAMAERMRAARLAIIGFGTSVTELAWHATPFLSVVHHEADRAPARDLEASGFGRVLGHAPRLDRVPIETHVRRALRDVEWLRESGARGHAALDGGLGAARILDRIEADLALGRTRPSVDGGDTQGRTRGPQA